MLYTYVMEKIMPETKNQKFGRLARDRLDKVRRLCGQIQNLAGPNYAYTREDVAWLRNELDTIFDETLPVFDKPKEIKDGE